LQDEEYYRPFETEPQFSTSKDWYCDYLLPYVFIQANVRNIIPQNCCAGIGRPSEEMGAISFVLGSFSNQEKEELEVTFQRGLQAVRIMVREGFNKSATFVNTPQPLEMLNR